MSVRKSSFSSDRRTASGARGPATFYEPLAANARNSLDALALIWFVVGNMWLLGSVPSTTSSGVCHDAGRSPVS